MIRYFRLMVITALLFTGCKKEDIPIYTTHNYIQFGEEKDSVTISFPWYPGEDYLYPMEVVITGQSESTDKIYRLEVDKEASTALEGTHFEMQSSYTFRSGFYSDTCLIRLIKTEDLKKDEKRLVIRISEESELLPGQYNKTLRIIRINDKMTQPSWWNSMFSMFYMGNYSEKKMRLFIRETGVTDLSDASDDEKRFYAVKFKYWLDEQAKAGYPVEEDNGDLMTVNVIN